jgi:hypothetical protein
MKRERALQVVLVLVGLLYSFLGYFLFEALWHSSWLNGHNDVLPMFLSLNTALGVCLLVAVKQPAKHRLLIAYGAWSSLAHGFTMTIQSAQAAAHGMHRRDSPWDIVICGVIGVALLALLPAKQPSPAGAPVSEPRFAER